MITLREVLQGSGGTLQTSTGHDVDAELDFAHVRHDSREIEKGDLFVAVIGENLDGHDFVGDAFAHGAGGALVDRAHADGLSNSPGPLVVVEDTIAGLQRLAAYWRAKHEVTVVGITGSLGKSSTKEVVWKVASQRFNAVHSRKSFNNEIGLPLSLLEIESDTDVVVLEMGGAYAFGEISALAEIALPEIGVVTNVSHSHLGRMGSLEAIAETKAELPASLPPSGAAVLNGDDHRVRAMAERVRGRVILFGQASDCQVRAEAIESHGLNGISLDLLIQGERHHLEAALLGAHSAYTIMAAAGVGLALGMSAEEMLPAFRDPSIRLRLLPLPGAGGATIIDDSYNANPTSSIAALDLLSETPAARRIAAFGDMLELGSYEVEGHRLVGRRAAEVVDELYTIGKRAAIIADEAERCGLAPEVIHRLPGKPALTEVLRDTMRAGDFVLVKGSRGIRMEDVVAGLRERTGNE